MLALQAINKSVFVCVCVLSSFSPPVANFDFFMNIFRLLCETLITSKSIHFMSYIVYFHKYLILFYSFRKCLWFHFTVFLTYYSNTCISHHHTIPTIFYVLLLLDLTIVAFCIWSFSLATDLYILSCNIYILTNFFISLFYYLNTLLLFTFGFLI